jgi:hypothetical protein
MSTKDVSDFAHLSMEELQEELATLAAHIYAGTCRFLELLGEIDRRGIWTDSGCGSCAEWLAWRCSLMPRAAREQVRVARRLPELPLIRAAFAQGEISYAKVRALTRVAEPDSEEELLQLGRVLTAAQLERAVRALRRVSSADAARHHEEERLGWWWDDDGALVVRGRLAPEDGALFLGALEAMRESLWERRGEEERGSAEPRPQPTNAEALAAMADAALTGATRSGGERHLVVVYADAEALARDAEGSCELDEGGAIAPETARRLACDASIVQMSERRGKPLRVGRRTRTISPVLRRALQRRDRRCRFPGCENRLFVDAHHIRHWARGGETRLDNLVLLCRRHHRLVHEGGYAVDERLRFYDPRGRPLARAPALARGDPDSLVDPSRGPRTLSVAWPERMDLAAAVGGMLRLASVGR